MRHRRSGRQLNRNSGQRKALFRNLTKELFTHEVIHTTEAKAKAVRPQAEKLITLAKHGVAGSPEYQIHTRRLAQARLNDPQAVKKLFDTLAPRYATRPGGYIRIVKLGQRKGDGAEMVQIELVEE
ncbi:MAG: 50S ribosomal protein L17 [Anaerolineae bacterium]|nr:50S ribosomal protein L17 [Anaerolineae bacterium]MCB9132805.1 50S ribosomal protein L17 [Anaerolineales bacterium]MCB0227621.1 50S ribosomal protein L17 [Anaerolineae bacterium]MCB0232726.1 50S ribosomal protein L17 [Anaerolineae bacterium]MCB0238275.1 50S ribosomal protein L17 [Anaerolineae bacterium]